MLLKLDNIYNNIVERVVSLISLRTSTNVFLYLALDVRDARISLLFFFSISAYYKASIRVFNMLNSLIA
jgi:hypothetical protein